VKETLNFIYINLFSKNLLAGLIANRSLAAIMEPTHHLCPRLYIAVFNIMQLTQNEINELLLIRNTKSS